MNKITLVARLREQLTRGLSIDGLAIMIDECNGFLNAHADNADAEIVGVFALRGILARTRRETERDDFPLAARLAKLEQERWPWIERCLGELDSTDGEASRYSVLNACVRELFRK